MKNKFVCDVHLGKLAKLLRLLGFDTAYENSFTKIELVNIGGEQERIVLSRDRSLSKNNFKVIIIEDEEPMHQLKQVVDALVLKNHFQLFSRCLICNGELKTVSKEEISNLLKENTSHYFNEFWQCMNCRRIYWKGSHYEKMLKTIESIAG
jgi:hypothetical protein